MLRVTAQQAVKFEQQEAITNKKMVNTYSSPKPTEQEEIRAAICNHSRLSMNYFRSHNKKNMSNELKTTRLGIKQKNAEILTDM